MVECSKDDLAGCCGKCKKKEHKVVAVIPVHGRLPLLKHTVERLYKKNGVHKVICVGHGHLERKLVESLGAVWVQHSNKPLGKKWNAGFIEARKYSPEACLFVGSSDWLSDNWLPENMPLLNNFDMVGTAGCYFMHVGISDFKVCYWPGYVNSRRGESIGIGRLLSSKVLDMMHWQPFNDELDRSLDNSMQQRVTGLAGKIQLIDNSKIKSLSISTDRWINKHRFFDHYNNILPSERVDNPNQFVNENFPEAKLIFL